MVCSNGVNFTKGVFDKFFKILNLISLIFIDSMFVVALALAIITTSGSTIHVLLVMLSISSWYFLVFVFMVSGKNLSLQYVNFMNYILRLFSRAIGGFDSYGSPLMHIMSSLNLTLE